MVSRGSERVLVLGGGHLGRGLADELAGENDVTLVDENEAIVNRANTNGVTALCAEPTDVDALRTAGVAGTDLAVVATTTDRQNVLATQLLRTRFGVEDVVVLVNDPDVREAVESLGTEAVCVPDRMIPELTAAIDRRVEQRG